jgi:hypothetical protein
MDPTMFAYDVSRAYINDNLSCIELPLAARLLGWVRSRNLAALATCSSLLTEHSTESTWRAVMQVEAFFKKNAVYADPTVCRQNAVRSFERAERICRITNKRLDHYLSKRERLAPDLRSYVSRMEMYIHDLLGPFTPFLDELPKNIRVSSGATAMRSRKDSIPHLKVGKRIDATSRAVPYLQALSEWFGYGKLAIRVLETNRVEFVPKNWQTERTIACEPTGNVPLQLAFDAHAKKRLRRRGIDLSNQSRNAILAKEGSITGEIATIDVRMASDVEAYNLVYGLFPYPWARYLDDVRSPRYVVDGQTLTYSKFSSMGNGSTFTVETIAFAAACYAVGSKRYSVYGDDIIVESELAEPLIRLLGFLGFAVNKEKSFVDGPFRESCGSHWFKGNRITPFYIREVTERHNVLAHNVNGLAAIAAPGGDLWKFLKRIVLEEDLLLVPFNHDSMSGVFIDVPTSHAKNIIRKKGPKLSAGMQALWFRGYKTTSPGRHNYDIRNLFLWHLRAQNERALVHEKLTLREPLISSRYTMASPKYRRSWFCWNPPAMATPVHLYWWTDFLTA